MARVKRGVTSHAKHNKKFSKKPKAITALAVRRLKLQNRLLRKPNNTLTATVRHVNVLFANFGHNVSTLLPASMASPIPALSTA